MIVDCHTHINSDADNIQTSEHLAASETVDVCIVLAEPDESSDQVNKKLSEYVSRHKDKMLGFAFVDPTRDKIGVKNLRLIKDERSLQGAVMYCSNCGFHPAHSRAMRLYESAEELGLPIFFHNDWAAGANAVLDYTQPFLLDEIAGRFPTLKIVIGTMGAPFVQQTLSMVAKHENVYADLTIKPSSVWQTYNTIVAAHEREVMDKLLFGSGFPSGRAEQCIETLLGFNKLLGDTSLPTVPRGSIRNIIERDTLELLGIKKSA